MGFWVIVGIISGVCMLRWAQSVIRRWSSEAQVKTDGSVLRYLQGYFLDPKKSEIEWNWQEPMEVGQTVSFKVKFYSNNGEPYNISPGNNIVVDISAPSLTSVVSVMEFASEEELKNKVQTNEVKVSFTVYKSGTYQISVTHNQDPVLNSPFRKTFSPGPLSAEHTLLARTSHASLSVVTMTMEKNQRLMIDARDQYDNKCASQLEKVDFEEKFNLQIREASNPSTYPAFTWEIRTNGTSQALVLDIVMYEAGCFKASLTYNGEQVKNGGFDVLVLNDSESEEVQRHVDKRNLNVWFECRMLNEDDYDFDETDDDVPLEAGTSSTRERIKSTGDIFVFPMQRKSSTNRFKSHSTRPVKQRKVYCYITPKQLIIKEFYFKIIPRRICTFRVSPATKLLCGDVDDQCGLPTLVLSDGSQPRVLLACSKRNVLAATFVGILHSNMGRSETLEGKVSFFNKQLCDHHKVDRFGRQRSKVDLNIDRSDLLASSFKETKGFSASDWTKQFVITFKDELGVDWGGLNKEWVQLICKQLFEAKSQSEDGLSTGGSGLFRRMKDDPQALVLPTPATVSGFKPKYYEFAGKLVGKCLLESAIGGEHSRQVAARFARSFLAQIIGLPVTYLYFESDDRDLYVTKVKYVAENDVSDMEMNFTEEIYSNTGSLEKVVDLVPHGSNISVTNENKRKYLNRFAQYRLSEAVKNEIEHFIKGLTSIVPDHLLSVFDENELELVMCGSSNISVEDMRRHSNTMSLSKNMENWIWAVVSSFTQEDLARLLQFTTGCALLPPDGFKALEPKFKISSAEYHSGGLPTAHTCFNELCIPYYDSYEELHRMLKIAITEGATGFGLV